MPGSSRRVAAQRHALDDAVLPAEVADDGVLSGAVVLETDVALTPLVAHDEAVLHRVGIQVGEEFSVLGARQLGDV